MRDGELRLEPLAGTVEGYALERPIRVYESSLPRADTGEALITIVTGGTGMRLTRAQACELYDWLDNWIGAHS